MEQSAQQSLVIRAAELLSIKPEVYSLNLMPLTSSDLHFEQNKIMTKLIIILLQVKILRAKDYCKYITITSLQKKRKKINVIFFG